LLYAVSDTDEVAPAKVLANFAKDHAALEIAGGFSDAGKTLDKAEVETLASMPTKEEAIAQVVAQLLSPVTDTISGLTGGISGIVSGLESHAA
jgi:large subunit ribosomal protein L10